MIDAAVELNMAVGLLTRRSKHRVMSGGATMAWITAEPLLVQLRLAVVNSSAPAGFKASTGSPMPVSADALDLLSQIAESVADHWWQTFARHHGQGRDTLAGQLRAWAMIAGPVPAERDEALGLTKSWVTAIDSLLHPVRRWEVRGSCPECKASEVITEGPSGTVRTHALSVIYDREGDLSHAVCAACGMTWTQLSMFARMIREQG